VTKYNVEEILEGIRRNDAVILQFVYKSFYPYVKFFILSNSGNEYDAQDMFQEAIIIIYKKLTEGELLIKCTFKTYLYSVCRLLWLKQLEKKKNKSEHVIEQENHIELSDEIYELSEQNEKLSLYQTYFAKLGDDCRKVLELSLDKVSLKKIAEIMGYKSEKYAKKRKYQCKEKLINEIKRDPKFKELQNETEI